MASLLALFAPSPPPPLSTDYSGTQFAWRFLVFRPALFVPQAILLLGVLLYLAIALYGKHRNQRTADALYNALHPLLARNFSAPASSSGLIPDGPTDFFVFSTGRRAVASLHTFLWQLYDLRYQPRDHLTLDFLLDADAAAALPDFVWAVINKSELTTIKDNRWDLTFTRTTEHSSLPPMFSIMSEFADVSDALFKLHLSPSTTLSTLLATPPSLTYLRSLSITDQPHERPQLAASYVAEKHTSKRVFLDISIPKQPSDILPLVDAVFALVDILAAGKVSLRPETKAKIRKVREDIEKEIREEEIREKKEEAAEDKKAAKRKAEQDKIARLSPVEQKKLLERNQKRALKKSQAKVVRKA
ncbi:DUF1682-domain-containing protein [Boletus reticuloceps]|uniref:DUF1682-domain-containing protein n=1 Tax=Boletus reticuloceps TaxID=495285 RepID=A0A8I2YSJ5_9AGAM|nr:DUF1682-domain-containing protein [Boletus reticuloceps]